MLRILTLIYRPLFAKLPAEHPKRTKDPVVSRQADASTLQAQKLSRMYLELDSMPTDPIELIRTKYIFAKKKAGNRRIYMPNKREYMRRLDSIMREIESTHHEVIERYHYAVPTTIGQKIQLEMENQKIRFYFNLVDDDPKMIAIMSAAVIVLAWFELEACQLPQYR